MSTSRWMAAVAVVIVGIVVFGYFSWPSPGGSAPDPPDARIDAGGAPHVAFREGGSDDWDLIPLVEAHGRAEQELGFAFALPALPLATLMPTRVAILSSPVDGPAQPLLGQYYTATVRYVLHPIIDDEGRVRVPDGFRVPARDDLNVPMTLSIEYPVSDLGAPPDADEVSTASIPRVAIQTEFVETHEEAVDWNYSWLIGDVRYQLVYSPDLRIYPREEMLAIVEATAAGQIP